MRGCVGVVAGLLIGAVMAFSALAVASLVDGQASACEAPRPSAWLIRAEVPWEETMRQVSSASVPLGGGQLELREMGPGRCGRLAVWADWTGAGLVMRGLGLELDASGGSTYLRPTHLRFGRLSLPLHWLPDRLMERVAAPLGQMGGAVLASQLQGEGVTLCGLAGEPSGLAVYLCGDDD